MAVFEHVLDPEIFNGDESVAINVVPSRLVGVILTLAGSAFFVGTGTAERVLCGARPPIVNCGDRIDLLADRRQE